MIPMEYENLVNDTKQYNGSREECIAYCTIALCGEVGELANRYKKEMRSGQRMSERENMLDELGDVLWYVTALSIELNSSLSQVMERNKRKLLKRLHNDTIKAHDHGDTHESTEFSDKDTLR